MNAALISLGSKSSMMILDAMKQYFTDCDNLDIRKVEANLSSNEVEILYEGKPLRGYDCVFARGSFRYAPMLRSLTSALQEKSYMPIRPEAFTIGHDKLLTHLLLQQHKVPMPKTYLSSSATAAKKILEKVNYPIILKFPSGTGGKGVMFAESFAAASSMMDALETLHQPFLLQEYIETGGVDIRAIVVGGKVAAAMKRKAIVGEKRSNIHAGGMGEPVQLDAHTKKIAVDAAVATGIEIGAVDILETPKGPVVIEVNLSPGLQGITAATKINVADIMAKYLFEQSKMRSETGKRKGADDIMKEISLESKDQVQNIVTNLDFRAERILLPKVVSDITGFNEKEELLIKARKGKVEICRYNIGN